MKLVTTAVAPPAPRKAIAMTRICLLKTTLLRADIILVGSVRGPSAGSIQITTRVESRQRTPPIRTLSLHPMTRLRTAHPKTPIPPPIENDVRTSAAPSPTDPVLRFLIRRTNYRWEGEPESHPGEEPQRYQDVEGRGTGACHRCGRCDEPSDDQEFFAPTRNARSPPGSSKMPYATKKPEVRSPRP